MHKRWRGRLLAVFVLPTVALSFFSFSSERRARAVLSQNRNVTLVLDSQDIDAFSFRTGQPVEHLLDDCRRASISVLALSSISDTTLEKRYRDASFSLLWQIESANFYELKHLWERVRPHDGLMSMSKDAIGYPLYLTDTASVIKKRHLFLPRFEFLPQKGVVTLSKPIFENTVKGHILHDREVVSANTPLWENRFLRAVRERHVRLIYLRLSPALPWSAHMDFIDGLNRAFISEGYELAPPKPFLLWSSEPFELGRWRVWGAVALACLAPVVALLFVLEGPIKSVILQFVFLSVVSLWVGLVIHGLGATPWIVGGLQAVQGVKIQLLLPLLSVLFLMMGRAEIAAVFSLTLKRKHFLLGIFLLAFPLILYVMRSGNYPMIPVTGLERDLRDYLDHVFGARPRFKEFALAHPLMIMGLILHPTKIWARALIWVGLIGQISILNTFMHFHIPLELCLLRSIHGLWLGALVSIPLIFGVKKCVLS